MAKMISGSYTRYGYEVYVTYTNGCEDELPLAVCGNNKYESSSLVSLDSPSALSLDEIRSMCETTVVELSEETGIANYESNHDLDRENELDRLFSGEEESEAENASQAA